MRIKCYIYDFIAAKKGVYW